VILINTKFEEQVDNSRKSKDGIWITQYKVF